MENSKAADRLRVLHGHLNVSKVIYICHAFTRPVLFQFQFSLTLQVAVQECSGAVGSSAPMSSNKTEVQKAFPRNRYAGYSVASCLTCFDSYEND